MAEYLINLARFVSYNEKKEIFKELKKKGYLVSNDSWSYRRLVVNKPVENKPYVASIIEITETFFQDNLSETINKLNKYNIKEIKTKIDRTVPFFEKAIVDRFLKKNTFKQTGDSIYIEARKKEGKVEVRIGKYLNEKNKPTKNKLQTNNLPDLAIESPYTLGEIGDFLRLSKTFNIKVYILTLNDSDSLENIKRFLKDNNFSKANISIIKDIDIIKNQYDIYSFSMWGKDSLLTINEKTNKKKLLLFGNEKRGLLKSTMEKSKKIIKIGSSSEPLRATQAASFALGYIFYKS